MMNLENVAAASALDNNILVVIENTPSRVFFGEEGNIKESVRLEFDAFFKNNVLPDFLKEVEILKLNSQPLSMARMSLGCSSCKVAAFLIGVGIVSAAAAGLTSITATSAIVIELAAFAGVSTAAALTFILTLGSAIASGVQDVVGEICVWTTACP